MTDKKGDDRNEKNQNVNLYVTNFLNSFFVFS